MGAQELVTEAYAAFDPGDMAALRALFADDAMIYIPGSTSISGDHSVDDLPAVLGAYRSGLVNQDRFNVTAVGDHAYAFLADSVRDPKGGDNLHYHVLHHWFEKDNKLAALWLFPHEYDLFERAWSTARAGG